MTVQTKNREPVHDSYLRENSEPHEASTPIPRLLLGLVVMLIGWAIYYIIAVNPHTPPQFGDRRTLADLAATGAATPGGVVDGAQVFSTQCIACHQATGQGIPGVFPPLAGSDWVNGKENLIVQILLHGIEGRIVVKGANYEGAMPNFGEKLNDAQIAAVTSYVRSQWGNSASAISAATVAAERGATRGQNAPWKGGDELARFR